MTVEEAAALFVPHVLEKRASFAKGKRLVHYTTAEAAHKIITGRQIWLRNAQMMNDFSEIQHGIDCLIMAWESDAGLALQAMLERIQQGLRDDLAKLFDGHADAFRVGTFITSLSEHDDSEDSYGRLSMWRAYGGSAGVALVLNNTVFASATDEMHVFSSPVFYHDAEGFCVWFQRWAGNLLAAEAALQEMGADVVRNWLFMVFRSFALCTKHPGFAEEREWRVFHSPMFEGQSPWVEGAVEIVRGIPQPVMKLNLRDDPSKGIIGVAPDTLINRIIIGPCDYPLQVRAGIVMALKEVGIENGLEFMWMSLIPLRHT